MQYLKPIEVLEATVKRYQLTLFGLLGIIALCLVLVPSMVKNGNPLLITTDSAVELAHTTPWNLSVERFERFTKLYLADRFEWDKDNFDSKKTDLKTIVSTDVFTKLRESFTTFQSLGQTQGARSFYVLEDFGFSNSQNKILAKVTRVLRIQNVAVATPLEIHISFQESTVSQSNPYGLTVTSVEEQQISK